MPRTLAEVPDRLLLVDGTVTPEELTTGDDDIGRKSDGPRVGRDGDRIALWLRGEQDLMTASLVSAALTEAIAVEDVDVVVDLREVEFMDASAIGVLVSGGELLGLRSRRLTVRSPQRGPRRVLQLCGLTELIEDPTAHFEAQGDGARTALETWVEVPAAGHQSAGSCRAERSGP